MNSCGMEEDVSVRGTAKEWRRDSNDLPTEFRRRTNEVLCYFGSKHTNSSIY